MAINAYVMDDRGFHAVELDPHCAHAISRPDATVWIDSDGRSDGLEAFLRDTLKIHPLAIEDIFADRLTPKVEDYGDYLYVVMHAVRQDQAEPDELGTMEIDFLIGPNWVFTHHSFDLPAVRQMVADLERNPREMQRGPAFLAHGLIDRLTDRYMPVMDRFEEEIDRIEKDVVERPTPKQLKRMFSIKRTLQRLRRISVYQRDMLQRLSRGDFEIIPDKARPFYRDVYDHFVRIADLADSYRELVTAALEIYMSVIANRTNDVMKALTLLSTIMLPLNFLAGLYGMNIDLPFQKWHFMFPIVASAMLTIAAVLYWQFKRRRWL